MLFPIPVELDELAAALASDDRLLEPFGFEVSVEETGAATPRTLRLLVRAVPEMLKDADPKPLLHDVLGPQADGGVATSAMERLDHELGPMAQLDGVDLRSHCPHGRPVLLRMPFTEIERRFGRT